jgi:ribosome-associated protein
MTRLRTTPRRLAHRSHPKPHGGAPALQPANPAAEALARRMAALALDKKSLDVVIIDVRGMTSYADYFVIASGESERQVSATAEHIREQLKLGGVSPVGSEGFESGHWVLLDYGEVVAHLFQTEARAFYDLEGLWSDAPRERVA